MVSEFVALDHIRKMQVFMARLGWSSYNGKCIMGFGEGGDLAAMSFVNTFLDRECDW